MKPLSTTPASLSRLLRGSLTGLLCLVAGAAVAQPAQKPLLSVASGAKPNLMITLDNSGSMGYSFHETYGVLADDNTTRELYRCVPGANGYPAYGLALGTRPTNTPQPQTTNASRVCLNGQWNWRNGVSGWNWYWDWFWQAGSAYPTARRVVGSFAAQRSPEVNPVYYNPKITYRLRKDASGNDIAPTDGIDFISNQTSTHSAYEYRNDSLYYHSTLGINDQTLFTTRTGTEPPAAPSYAIYASYRIPKHVTYTTLGPTDTAPATFSYARCAKVMTNTQSGLQDGCEEFSTTTITYPGTATTSNTTCVVNGACTTTGTTSQTYIDLPAGHARTDCEDSGVANRCTVEEEITNIVNWYRYYFNRQEAATTAIGQALANTDLEKEIRVGYMLINRKNGDPMDLTPGADTGSTNTLRGVRRLEKGTSGNTELYNWLYGQTPHGGTPLHNAVNRIAAYYSVGSGARENPWTKDPSQMAAGAADSPTATNPEMSCRRSFQLLFSDGAWNDPVTDTTDYDNSTGANTFSRTLPDGSTETFTYQPEGIDTSLGRKMYTPYPSAGTGGLADRTAEYFWHRDQRPALKNGIVTRPGQPTFWQNIATYTVGYQIAPVSPLTFSQISNYQTEYAANGYAAATKPSWPTGSLTSTSGTVLINDFIHAGYTGGGRGFSARSADDVRSIFETVLSEILNSSGNDAGVAVSGSTSGTDTSTLDGRIKFSVSYNTNDNSGNVEAEELGADGSVTSVIWSADGQMPDHADREVFTISEDDTPVEFKGVLSGLPTDVQDALKDHTDSARIASDASFVDYLRGKDPVSDTDSKLFRQRSKKLGAMVNPPSTFMGGNQDMLYDLDGSVDGAEDYQVYMQKRRSFPASLFVATNAGVMHALNAETGAEMAGYMPRRSLKRMLDYANADYDFSYILDGPLSENDFYIANPDDTDVQWQHVAVGTGGRGEKLVYAVRSPLEGSAEEDTADRTPGKVDFLWENGPDNINDTEVTMGYVTTKAVGGQTENGTWVVVLPSGHYNGETYEDSGKTHNKKNGLIVLDARTGKLIRNIALPGTYHAGRGLGGVTLMRKEKRIVGAYAGDANGNMWRFDLRGDPAGWNVLYDMPIFTTENNRPIYGAPAWQEHPKKGAIVVFATGMLLDQADYKDVDQNEAIYGIWDPTPLGEDAVLPFSTRSTSKLVEQTMVGSGTTAGIGEYFKMSDYELDWEEDHGWTFKLGSIDKGERNLDRVQNFGAAVFLATTVIAPPEDEEEEICRVSDLPINYLYILDALTGTLTKNKTSFDVLDKDDNVGKDGKGDGFIVARIESGGFTREVVLPPTYKTPPAETPTEEQCKGDCDGYVPPEQRGYQPGGQPLGEPSDPPPCGKVGTTPIGVNDGTPGAIADNCVSVGWKRTQYQLSAPPAN